MPTLLLIITGPMQSWGYQSRFDIRDSSPEPTRSGIIGLICCAMGIPRGDVKERQFYSIHLGIRVDAPGVMRADYQTVMGILTANNKTNVNAQTWRYYLEDARFLVGIEHDSVELLKNIEERMNHPEWPIYLGRKSYVPSLPLTIPGGSIRNRALLQALKEEPWYRVYKGEREPVGPLRIMVESNEERKTLFEYKDFPLNFKKRKFTLRKVAVEWVHEYKVGGILPCIFQE